MKTSTALGLGLGGAAILGIGWIVTRKPKRTNGGGTTEGQLAPGDTKQIAKGGCVGMVFRLPEPDDMGNKFSWSVYRAPPENTYVNAGVAKTQRAAEAAVLKTLKWQICTAPKQPYQSGVPG